MLRREFIIRIASGTAFSLSFIAGARAQQAGARPGIGFLSPASASARSTNVFRGALSELGYVEGQNITIVYRFAEGNFERLPAQAAEIVAAKVVLIVAVVTQASIAAARATKTIPIVMAGVSDPVGAGLVASLGRPGGNVTGTSSMSAEVVGKSVEVLKEAFPNTSRLAVIWNPDNAIFQRQMLREAELAAATLGIRMAAFGVRGLEDLEGAFEGLAARNSDAILVLGDPILNLHAARIVASVRRSRLPAMYGAREMMTAGGLMCYAPDIAEQFRRAAIYVDKILKGAKPEELPVEQPTKFELVVNFKTAREMGFTLPSALLFRADEIIE